MRRLLAFILCVALFAGAGLAVRTWGISLVKISGKSMNDTLMTGDIVLVTRFDYAGSAMPDRMDVVQCRFDGRTGTYVKRVIGLPGERIVYEDSMLEVNGNPVSEPYVTGFTDDFYVTLGDNEYFVMGDNRSESHDSRAADMGSVGGEDFLGRARWILWPAGRFGPVD